MPDDRFLHRRAGHSEKVNLLTDLEYRVWTQFILSADDFGVMRGGHRQIQADNDHLANRPAKVIQRCLDALTKDGGLLRTFTHQGKPYVYQHDWQRWQKVSYPRTTNLPAPPADALERCDDLTQKLFALHPGGAGRTRKEHSQNIPETFSEDSALTRASAPAERLTANGTRPMAEANGGLPLDVAFQEFVAAYPGQGRCANYHAQTAFVEVLSADPNVPHVMAFQALLARLDGHKRSHQWRVKTMIPRLDRYLREGLHLQELPEHPPTTLITDKSARTLTSGAAFVAGGANGPR